MTLTIIINDYLFFLANICCVLHSTIVLFYYTLLYFILYFIFGLLLLYGLLTRCGPSYKFKTTQTIGFTRALEEEIFFTLFVKINKD